MFRVSARTVLELGAELISSDVIAFYELIKNGFDAQTSNGVDIKFRIVMRKNHFLSLERRSSHCDSVEEFKSEIRNAIILDAPLDLQEKANEIIESISKPEQAGEALRHIIRLNSIEVSDSGSGMSMAELNRNFLVIGTASRKLAVDDALKKGESKTPYLGEKGIGRLSAMRLGNCLRVVTAREEDTHLNVLDIDWNKFSDLNAMIEDVQVAPTTEGEKPEASWSGTSIIIGDLLEDWSELRIQKIVNHEFARLTDPFANKKERPRVGVYWNGKRLSVPWMDRNLLKNAHASIKGEYTVIDGTPQLCCTFEAIDLGFDHPYETHSTIDTFQELQGLIGGTKVDIDDEALSSLGPFTFEAYWFNRKRLSKIDGIGDISVVRELQRKWSGILLFRDGFRIFPYGEDDDDWLKLDRKALGRKGYLLNKAQFVGRVNISRVLNPYLIDQTNREGLRESPEQQVLLGLLDHAIDTHLVDFLAHVESKHKNTKVDLKNANTEITSLRTRAKSAIRSLKKKAPKETQPAVEDLQQTLLELTEFARTAEKRIKEVEKESQQMVEMAGVGLMVEVVAHELARASESAIHNLNLLSKKDVPARLSQTVNSLQAQMKSLSKRIRILDPLSISGRQRKEVFCLKELIDDTLEAHDAQFKRHSIQVNLEIPDSPLRIRAVKGMIVQILENLISNSKYWIEVKKARSPNYQAQINLSISDSPLTLYYSDNGRGIDPQNKEKIFRPFFSLKEKSKRRGIGLYIARECTIYHGGSLELSDVVDPETKRLHTFRLELPGVSL